MDEGYTQGHGMRYSSDGCRGGGRGQAKDYSFTREKGIRRVCDVLRHTRYESSHLQGPENPFKLMELQKGENLLTYILASLKKLLALIIKNPQKIPLSPSSQVITSEIFLHFLGSAFL